MQGVFRMRVMHLRRISACVLGLVCLTCQPAKAALTWRIDFNGSSLDTQSTPGFTGWLVSNTSHEQTFTNVDGGAVSSNMTVQLNAGGGSAWSVYQRTMNAGVAVSLYRDGAQYNNAGGGMTVSTGNLTPGVLYAVRFWYFDDEYTIGTVQSYVNVTDGAGEPLGTLTNVATANLAAGNAGLPNDLYDSRYCLYAEITAGDAGTVDVTITPGSAANVKLNAMEVIALGEVPPRLTYSGTVLDEADTNDGSITNTLTIMLANDSFTGSDGDNLIPVGKASVANVPAGLTAVLVLQDATTALLSLTGQAASHAAADSINDLSVTFADSAFSTHPAADVIGFSRTDLAIHFSDPLQRSLDFSSTVFYEAATDDGSIGNTLTLTLSNEQFAGSNGENFITSGKVLAANVPAGLTAVLTRQDATTAVFSLTGQAFAHVATNSITDLSLTFDDSAFSGGDAAGISGASRADLCVNFNGLVIEGPPDGVFLAWSSCPGAHYRIVVSTNLLAPDGGFVPVVTNIPATPAYNQRYIVPSGGTTGFYRVVRE